MAQLEVGDRAPAFTLVDQSGTKVKLTDFKGKQVVLYFYPKADTPGCTTQSCEVRDHRKDLAKLGAEVFGISPDTPAKQAKFDAKYKLGFPLLADEDHAVAEKYGAWGEKSMYGRKYMGIVRSAFVIDEKGKIAGAFYKVSPKEHSARWKAHSRRWGRCPGRVGSVERSTEDRRHTALQVAGVTTDASLGVTGVHGAHVGHLLLGRRAQFK